MWQAATHCPHCKIKYGMQLQRYDKETKAMKTKVVEKVRDHSHRTGKFRGDLCRDCNLALGVSENADRHIPIIMHNLKGYDMHHILHCLAADDLDKEKLNVVPQNGEKFITFTWSPRTLPKEVMVQLQADMKGASAEDKAAILDSIPKACPVRFIDSAAFMAASLETLVDNLPDSRKVFLKESATVNGAVDPRLFELGEPSRNGHS